MNRSLPSEAHQELRAGQRLPRGAVPLLDDQFSLGLVGKSQGYCAPFLDLDRLGLGIDEEAIGSFRLRDDHALSGLQTVNADLTVDIRLENAIGIADQGAIRISHFEFRIGQCYARIDGANLTDQQNAIGGIFEGHGDYTLFTFFRAFSASSI